MLAPLSATLLQSQFTERHAWRIKQLSNSEWPSMPSIGVPRHERSTNEYWIWMTSCLQQVAIQQYWYFPFVNESNIRCSAWKWWSAQSAERFEYKAAVDPGYAVRNHHSQRLKGFGSNTRVPERTSCYAQPLHPTNSDVKNIIFINWID